MHYLRNISRVLIFIVVMVVCCCMVVTNDYVASDEAKMTMTEDNDPYEPAFGPKYELSEHEYSVEIVDVTTTTTESTTTTTEETTTTTEETTTTEVTTTTSATTTTATTITTTAKTTKKVTTTKATTTKNTNNTTTTTVANNSPAPITQAEFYMLANLVAHEYGADWVSLHEKAKVVMTVMNRVRSNRYPNTIREVILQRNQYCWVPDSYYWRRTTQSCKDAVTYYFNHQSEYSTTLNSFYGKNGVNHFYAG